MADTLPWEDYQQSPQQGTPWQDYGQGSAGYVPPDMDRPLSNNPLSGMSFLQNALYGFGQVAPNMARGAEELYARATNNQPLLQRLQSQVASDRGLEAPVSQSWGGRVGNAVGTAAVTAPAMLVPGAQSVAGGALLGGLTGALQPTTANESALGNAAIGGVNGGAFALGGRALGAALSRRAAQPLMGWTPESATDAAAASFGAKSMSQNDVGDAYKAMQGIFTKARSPDVSVPVGDDTANALESAAQGLNDTSAGRFAKSASVRDLTRVLGENPTAQQLGNISSQLGKEATTEFSGAQGADPLLGKALFALREHVDDLVGGSITDPELASAYQGVRGQYRNYLNVTHSPTIYNSAAGTVNASALGRYLQGADEAGYMRGGNDSLLYQAARWGQKTGEGKGAPRFTLDNLALPFFGYYAANNPLSRGAVGALSRVAAPIAPALPYGLPGIGISAGLQTDALFR